MRWSAPLALAQSNRKTPWVIHVNVKEKVKVVVKVRIWGVRVGTRWLDGWLAYRLGGNY